MPRLRMNELKAPIEYSEIRRGDQLLRAVGAILIGGLGGIGLIWGASEWVYFVVPATLALAHAAYRLYRPGTKAVTSLLVDITLFGSVLMAIGGVPEAETAIVAYLIAASLLLLSLVEAALDPGLRLAVGSADRAVRPDRRPAPSRGRNHPDA